MKIILYYLALIFFIMASGYSETRSSEDLFDHSFSFMKKDCADNEEEEDDGDDEEDEDGDEDEDEEDEDQNEEDELKKETDELWIDLKKALTTHNQAGLISQLQPIFNYFKQKEPEYLVDAMHELIEIQEEPKEFISEIQKIISDFEMMQLVNKFHKTKNTSGKEQLKESMRAKLKIILKQRIEQREREIAEIEEELKGLKEGLKKAKTDPTRYIEKKIQSLIGQKVDPFEW